MDALAGERVQEHRKGGDQGFTLTGRHLGDAATLLLVGLEGAVQDDAADELHVVVDHVPGDLVAAGDPVVLPHGLVVLDVDEIAAAGRQVAVEVRRGDRDGLILGEAAGGGFHDGKGLGEDLVEALFDGVVLVLDQFVGFRGEVFFLGNGDVFLQFRLDFGDTVLEGLLDGEDLLPEGGGTRPELVVGEGVDAGIGREDLVQHGLHLLHVPVGLGAENFLQYICECHRMLLKIQLKT